MTGRSQPISFSVYVSETGCSWDDDFSLVVPTSWQSGIYAAKCCGWQRHAALYPFHRQSPNLDRTSRSPCWPARTRWNSYNEWGGKSAYTADQGAPFTSFERPESLCQSPMTIRHPREPIADPHRGNGPPQPESCAAGGTLDPARWLEARDTGLTFTPNRTSISTHHSSQATPPSHAQHPSWNTGPTTVICGHMAQYLSQAGNEAPLSRRKRPLRSRRY